MAIASNISFPSLERGPATSASPAWTGGLQHQLPQLGKGACNISLERGPATSAPVWKGGVHHPPHSPQFGKGACIQGPATSAPIWKGGLQHPPPLGKGGLQHPPPLGKGACNIRPSLELGPATSAPTGTGGLQHPPHKRELENKLAALTTALDNAGATLEDVSNQLLAGKTALGGEAYMEQQKNLAQPAPEFLKLVSMDMWVDRFDKMIEHFQAIEHKMRSDLRKGFRNGGTPPWSAHAFAGTVEAVTSFCREYAARLLEMVRKPARVLWKVCQKLWDYAKEHKVEAVACVAGMGVGALMVHAGIKIGIGAGIGAGATVIGVGILAVAAVCAVRWLWKWHQNNRQAHGNVQAELDLQRQKLDDLKSQVDKLVISEENVTEITSIKETMIMEMVITEEKFIVCDAPRRSP